MKFSKRLLLGLAGLALASSAMADTLYSQGFDNLSTSGWLLTNNSTPVGQSWFQGTPENLAAHSGDTSSYVAANFLSATNGTGAISNWLISPEISFGGNAASVSFFASAAPDLGYVDTINVYFSSGSGSSTGGFSLIGTLTAPIGGWTSFSFATPAAASGRIAFEYVATFDTGNYAAIDDVSVSAVPEPTSMLMLAAGLAGIACVRRRQAAREQR